MTYDVERIQTALKELAALWVAADSTARTKITKSTNEIDSRLSQNPLDQGESRPGGRRIVFEAPLAVIFRVDGNLVTVLHVWRFRQKGVS